MFLMFNVLHGYISLQFLKNLKLNRLINIEYQHKSKSVTKGCALFTHIDHKYELCSNKALSFSGSTKNDVNLVKLNFLIFKSKFRFYIPKFIVILHVMSHFMSHFMSISHV